MGHYQIRNLFKYQIFSLWNFLCKESKKSFHFSILSVEKEAIVNSTSVHISFTLGLSKSLNRYLSKSAILQSAFLFKYLLLCLSLEKSLDKALMQKAFLDTVNTWEVKSAFGIIHQI